MTITTTPQAAHTARGHQAVRIPAVVDHDAVFEHSVELLVVDSVGSFDLAVQSGVRGLM